MGSFRMRAGVSRARRGVAGSVLVVAFSALGISSAFASGYGQGSFDDHGIYGDEIGASGPTGYTPAPGKITPNGSGQASFSYTFTAHRYTGPNHVPYTQAISIPMEAIVYHLENLSGTTDTQQSFDAGDPGYGTTVGANQGSGDPNPASPPFGEPYMLAKWLNITEAQGGTAAEGSKHGSSNFVIYFPALPSGTSNSTAAAQQKSYTIYFTTSQCGYFQLDTGASDAANSAHQHNGFAILVVGYVRVAGCPGGSGGGTPTPTSTPTPHGGTPTPTGSHGPNQTPTPKLVTPVVLHSTFPLGIQGINTGTPITGSMLGDSLIVGVLVVGFGFGVFSMAVRRRRQ